MEGQSRTAFDLISESFLNALRQSAAELANNAQALEALKKAAPNLVAHRAMLEPQEAWKGAHYSAMAAFELTDMVRLGTVLLTILDLEWHSLRSRAAAGLLVDCRRSGHFRNVLERSLTLVNLLEEVTQIFADRGSPIESAENLGAIADSIREIQSNVLAQWPWVNEPGPAVDRRLIEESRAAVAQGECQDVEDLLRELQGDHPEAG